MQRRVPRKTKKAMQAWMVKDAGWQWRHPHVRARILRWIQNERTRNGLGPLRRLPDGRVSTFDLV
jgi:hypothetical protein